jgi:hypothetical protein
VRFEKNTFGANDHFIRFDSGGEQKVALKKLRPEDWEVLAPPEPVSFSGSLCSAPFLSINRQSSWIFVGFGWVGPFWGER